MAEAGGPASDFGLRYWRLVELFKLYGKLAAEPFPEVTLSVLLEAFAFSLTDKEIVWNFAGICYPTMGKDTDKPSLVLRAENLAPEVQ